MPQPSKQELDRRKAYLLHALGYVCSKDSDRELLVAGDARPVSGIVTGQVGKGEIVVPFAGTLQIGHDTTVASSTAPRTVELLASILVELPAATVNRILAELPDRFPLDRGLLSLAADQRHTERAIALHAMLARVEEIVQLLRTTVPQQRRGSVRFERTQVDT